MDNLKPEQIEDSLSDFNPYDVPNMIWELIEPYFERYKVEITDSYPTKNVTRPTITWAVIKRTPGREGSKIHGKGSNFAKFLKVTSEGYVHERHIQQQQILIEYTIFATSTSQVEKIAWDLERAVLETVGVLQERLEGFQLVFDQQTPDSSMLWRQQDELIKRTIRFSALVPVPYTLLVPELRFIEIVESWGRLAVDNTVLTRNSSDKKYYITVDDGQRVVNISQIYLEANDGWKALELGTDFNLRKDSNQLLYIEWNDDFGKVPTVGQEFRVDYEITQLVKGHTITPQ